GGKLRHIDSEPEQRPGCGFWLDTHWKVCHGHFRASDREPLDRLPHHGLRGSACRAHKAQEETMRNNKNKGEKPPPKVQWSAGERARHQAIRESFRNWQPSPEELIASGQGADFDLQGEYRELRPF